MKDFQGPPLWHKHGSTNWNCLHFGCQVLQGSWSLLLGLLGILQDQASGGDATGGGDLGRDPNLILAPAQHRVSTQNNSFWVFI